MMRGRVRSWLAGGEESAWDVAVPCGLVLAGTLFIGLLLRGAKSGEMTVMDTRARVLLVVYALGMGLLVAAPFAAVVLGVAWLPRDLVARKRRLVRAAAIVFVAGGLVAPLAFRTASSVQPGWMLGDEPFAWDAATLAGRGAMVLAGDETPAGVRWDMAWLAERWAGAAAAGAACWLMLSGMRRVRVGWCVAVATGLLSAIAQAAVDMTRISALPPSLVIQASALAGAMPVVLAWVASAWLARVSDGAPAVESSPPRASTPRILAAAAVALVGWLALLRFAVPVGWSLVADAMIDPPRAHELAPDFELLDRDGRAVRLSDQRGHAVLVTFWASWCGPCQREFPHVAALAEEHLKDGLVVLAISRDADRAAMDAFLAEQPRIPRVLLADVAVGKDYDVRGIPVTYLVDRDGRVAWWRVGFGRDADELRAEVAKLLEAPSPRG